MRLAVIAQALERRSRWWAFVLLGVLCAQGVLLNSDMAHELLLAEQLLRGVVSGEWHHSHFPVGPSIFLLPAALAGRLGGSGVAELTASVEFVLLGAWTAALAARWSRRSCGASAGWSRVVALAAVLTTPLWVYFVKAPMDAALATTATLAAVVALSDERDGAVGVALAGLALSRDQMIPVALAAALYLAWRLVRQWSWSRALRWFGPLAVAGVVTLASNAARFGSAFNFGPGYQSSLSWNTRVLLELVGSWSSGLLWFAPLALWGVVTLVRRARGGDTSVRLALVLVGSTLLSAVLIHPNRNPDLLQQWIGWSGGVRFALPALGILIASIPEPRRFASRLALASAALVGFVWNLSMLLVPYNAQERIAPVAGFHPPQPWRQWSLVPTAWHNTWHLIVTGSTSRHSSAFFLSFWQVGALRQYGRVTLLLTVPLSAGLLVGGVLVLRRAARDEA